MKAAVCVAPGNLVLKIARNPNFRERDGRFWR